METIQVVLFFIVSYLISRVFVKLKIPEIVVYYLIERKHISIQKLSLILILGATLVSTIVMNVVAVLTLMPLVLLLQKEMRATDELTRKFNTLFLLTVLWGANIGGIGTLTGTTTNGILLGLYDMYNVEVGQSFTFISWAAWGLPLCLILSLTGWMILMAMFNPGKMMQKADFFSQLEARGLSRKLQKTGFKLALFFIITASVLSYLQGTYKDARLPVLIITAFWTLGYIYLFLIQKWRTENGDLKKLIKFQDIIQNIPKRGLMWMGIAFIVTYILWQLHFHDSMAKLFSPWLTGRHRMFVLYWIFALLTTFSSELISNTAVQFSMLMVLFPLTKISPDLSWQGMLIITLCSSCAFMTPLATPSNGLGFGSSAKISLKYMFFSGFVMNIASSLVIVSWVHYVVPIVLRLFI